MPPKAKAKVKAKAKPAAKPAAKAKIDRYAYLPTDLQRAAVHMDRADFMRKLQKSQHDREYRHAAVQHGDPPLSAHGGRDLQEKLAALRAEVAILRRSRKPSPAPATASTAAPGTGASRVTFGGSSASRMPMVFADDDIP
jgi:hypothetical protein